MELKHVIPNMEKTFGNLEFAGENKVEQRRINGRMVVISRSYNLYRMYREPTTLLWCCLLPMGRRISRSKFSALRCEVHKQNEDERFLKKSRSALTI